MSYPLIFDSTAVTFSTLGNGVLSDAISCIVTENLNGSYELELNYPANGLHAEYIQLDAIIVCQANLTAPRQAFRIYDIKQQINGIATINARHISYDLNGYAVEPFTATTLEGALAGLLSNAAMSPPFSISADFDSAAAFKVTAPSPVRSWFGGREGSILDIYGGEWEYDNFACRLRSRRGVDNGVRVQYSKNIGSYAKELKSETIFSHVCAVWSDEETGASVRSVFVATGVTDVTRVKFLDVSSDYQEQPTQAELTAYATSKAPDYRAAALNIAVGVIPMNDIQDVIELGDTVHVYYMNDIFVTRCVTVVWNVLKEKYDSISVGALKTSLAASIGSAVSSEGYATKKDVLSLIGKATSKIGTLTDSSNSAMAGALLRSGRAVSFLIPYSGIEGCNINVTAFSATIYGTDGSLGNATASDIESATCTPFGIRIVLVKSTGWGGINATPVTVVIGNITAEITR